MKKTTCLLIVFLLTTGAFAQIRFGVDGALGYSNGTVPNGDIYISVGPGGSSGEGRDSFDKQLAFRLGVYGEYFTTDYFGVQLGVKYADYGFDLEDTSVDIDYIDVDIFADFYPFSNFFLNIGVTPSFLIKSPKDSDFETFDVRIGGQVGYAFMEKYKLYFMLNSGLLDIDKSTELGSTFYGLGVSIPISEVGF